ncbi:6-carboxyhexanoate--CoA ligase [Persephonella sp.]
MRLYTIKARSSLKGIHISGAERIVPESQLQEVLSSIQKKITRKEFDTLNIKVELLDKPPAVIKKALPIKEIRFSSYTEANRMAIELISKATGLDKKTIEHLIKQVHSGASPDGNNMRGAMVVDHRGIRVEPDRYRGIRTSSVDFKNRQKITEILISRGFTERTADALCIATKNIHSGFITAEYCISDEPDYTAGYVATGEGYFRLLPLKEKGNPKGGRIYFIKEGTDLEKLQQYLQKEPVLIEELSD